MSDMLERCARALCIDRDPDNIQGGPHPHGLWIDEGEPWWTGYTVAARAVLEALREPTSDVLSAGERALVHCSPVHWGRAKAVWQAAIDTALKDTP